jgi:thioredoxin 1
MADIVDVSDNSFQAEVLDSAQPVIVDFWAEWCGPCRQIAPIIKEIAGDYDGKVKVVKVNVDEAPQTAGAYGIRSIPSVLAFQGGQVVEQLMGARPKASFIEMADKLL